MGVLKIKSIKNELRELVLNSNLNENKKILWELFLKNISEDDALLIMTALGKDKFLLEFLTKNLDNKLEAMLSGDKKRWKSILEEERDYIEIKSDL